MTKMAASSQFANAQFPMRKLRNVTLVQFLSQRNMQLRMVLKFLKVRQPLLYLLVYLETVQKATVSTAGTGKLIGTLNA